MAGLFGGKAAGLLGDDGGAGLTFRDRAMAAMAALNGDMATAIRIRQMPGIRAQQKAALDALTARLSPTYQDGPPVEVSPPMGLIGGQSTQPDLNTVPMPGAMQPPSPPTPAPATYQPPQRTSDPLSMNSPDLAKLAMQAEVAGVPISSLLEVLKGQQPSVHYDRGFGFDQNTGRPMGGFHPDLDKGQTLTPGGSVMNLPGAVQSASDMAGGVAGAQEQAKAALDIIPVNMPDGSTRQMPRFMAAQMLAQAAGTGGGAAVAPGGQAPGVDGAGLGMSQSPADKITAEGNAKTQVDRTALLPKQNAMLGELDNRSALTSQIIHQILGDRLDPATGQWRSGGKSMINPMTTGVLGGNLSGVWQPSHDLSAQIDHVRAMTALDELEKLREDSPTGAGLGRVTQQEINLLAAMRGSVDQKQGGAQLAQNLRRQLGQLDQIRANRHQQYQETYGAPARVSPAAKPAVSTIPLAERLAEARRRGLIQ